jgi:hypothetical protein
MLLSVSLRELLARKVTRFVILAVKFSLEKASGNLHTSCLAFFRGTRPKDADLIQPPKFIRVRAAKSKAVLFAFRREPERHGFVPFGNLILFPDNHKDSGSMSHRRPKRVALSLPVCIHHLTVLGCDRVIFATSSTVKNLCCTIALPLPTVANCSTPTIL